MDKITSKISLIKKSTFISLLVVCSLFMFENMYSWQKWKHESISVSYEDWEDCILITWELFNYDYGDAHENGYMQNLEFYYSSDAVHYEYLMKTETSDQNFGQKSWLTMKNKVRGTKIQFFHTQAPDNRSFWSDTVRSQRVEVFNTGRKAFMSVKWYVDGTDYAKVRYIKVSGIWHVNGAYPKEIISDEIYVFAPKSKKNPPLLQSDANTTVSNDTGIKVFAQSDEVVIKGAVIGENINIYSISGTPIKSILINSDIAKVKLAKNQMYVVKVGQAHYKVAL